MESRMRSASVGILFLGLFVLSTAFPAPIEENPEEGDKFEGDILLSLGQRNGLLADRYRWSEGKVFYNIHEEHFDAAHINHIQLALQQIEDVSCIRFYPVNDLKTGYINITGSATGCYSNVGYQGRAQVVNFQVYPLDTGCFRIASMCHELLHALGFYHQQAAADRDQFVTILYENIQQGMEYNFNTYTSSVVGDFGVPYDYGSVMHYGPKAFSKNGEPTIVPLDPTAVIGQRETLSPKDIEKLNLMYNCPGYA